MRVSVVACAVAVLLPGILAAEPISGTAAKKMLFSPRGVDVQIPGDSGLTTTQREFIKARIGTREFKAAVGYYGAVAVSPAFFPKHEAEGDAAALSGLFQISTRLHSVQAAESTALAACNAARGAGDAACLIAARIVPKRYKPQALTLSDTATTAMKLYRKGKGTKAMAVSTGTAAYAIAKGEGAAAAALASCNASAIATGAPDCEVLIAD